MDDRNFEKMLADKLIKSMQENPEDWESSILGIKRKSDKVDINVPISGDGIEIDKPYKYEFKDPSVRKNLTSVAKVLHKKLAAELLKRIEEENREKLSEFFNLDTRKNKLEALREISEERYDIDIEEETGEIKEKPWWKFW